VKPIGAFVSYRALREVGGRLLDEYGIEYVHTHFPIFLDECEDLYRGVQLKPEKIDRSKCEEVKSLVQELRSVGLKFFAGYPVFVRPRIARDRPEYSAWTLLGKPHPMRVCPTNTDFLRKVVADLRAFIRLYGVDGVVLDFIRFESPMAGFDNFLSCFCPSCQEEMRRRGYDPYTIKRDWLRFADFLGKDTLAKEIVEQGVLGVSDVLDLYDEFPGVFEWFRFRKEYIEDVVKVFASAVREEGGRGTIVGANVLSPWWSLLAGQSYRAFSKVLDVIEPMLYFDWMQWEGLTAVKELSRAYGVDKNLLTKFYYVAMGLNALVKPRGFDETRLSGLPAHSIEASLRKIASWNVGGAKIWPVIIVKKTDIIHELLRERLSNTSMADREFFVESVKSAARGGADGLVYWNFDGADRNVLRELYAVWRSMTGGKS